MSEWLLILGTEIKPCQRQTHCIVRDGQRTGKGSQCGSFPGGNSKTVRKVAEGARAVGTGTCPVGSGNKSTTKQHSYYTMMVWEEPGKRVQNRIRSRGQSLNSHVICVKLVHRFNQILLIKTNCCRSFSRSF